eukprot:3395247-Alexandrium_andersonii.AAC.1
MPFSEVAEMCGIPSKRWPKAIPKGKRSHTLVSSHGAKFEVFAKTIFLEGCCPGRKREERAPVEG